MNLSKTNLFFAYMYIIGAVALAIVYYLEPKKLDIDMDLYRYQITGLDDNDEVTVSGKKEFDITTKYIQILIIIMLSIAGFFHLFYFSNGFGTGVYNKDINRGINKYRWFELSITSAIIIFISTIMSGLRDYNTVILTCILIAAMMCFGFYVERSRRIEDKTIALISFCGILAAVFSLIYNSLILNEHAYREEDSAYPRWARDTLIGVGVWFILLCILTITCAGGFGKGGFNYPSYEKYYTYLAFILKAYVSGYITYGILSS